MSDLIIGDVVSFERAGRERTGTITGYRSGSFVVQDIREVFIVPEAKCEPVYTRWDALDDELEMQRTWKEVDEEYGAMMQEAKA